MIWLLICYVTLYAQVGERFRFALLTDLHVTERTTAAEDLERTVNQLNETPDIDLCSSRAM